LHRKFTIDKTKKNEMGGACGTYGIQEKLLKVFRWEGLRERGYLEDLGLDGRIILKLTFKTFDGSMDWISLAQESGK